MVYNLIGGASGGLKPTIIVTAPTGSTVTCDGITGTEISGKWTFIVTLGQHTIEAILEESTILSKVINIDNIGIYSIALFPYDYGDGSLNTVELGYENNITLYCNGKTTGHDNVSNYLSNATNFRIKMWTNYSYSAADMYPILAFYREYARLTGGTIESYDFPDSSYKFLDNKGILCEGFHAGAANTNIIDFTNSVNGEKTIWTYLEYGALTSGIYVGQFKYLIDGVYYTLQEMVANEICKPLVIIDSHGTNGNYYFSNCLNIYNGGNSNTGNFPCLHILFMLNSGHILSGMQFYANKARGSSSYNDGFRCVVAFDTEHLRFTLNEY